ncbi:MAG TPA: hypothetical protein VKF38_12630 [Anaerolineaceae bacterium]|nr:hypothetical protein [Anaerolineaceae bacterium]
MSEWEELTDKEHHPIMKTVTCFSTFLYALTALVFLLMIFFVIFMVFIGQSNSMGMAPIELIMMVFFLIFGVIIYSLLVVYGVNLLMATDGFSYWRFYKHKFFAYLFMASLLLLGCNSYVLPMIIKLIFK